MVAAMMANQRSGGWALLHHAHDLLGEAGHVGVVEVGAEVVRGQAGRQLRAVGHRGRLDASSLALSEQRIVGRIAVIQVLDDRQDDREQDALHDAHGHDDEGRDGGDGELPGRSL